MRFSKFLIIVCVSVATLVVSPLLWVELGARYGDNADAQRLLARWHQDGAWLHKQDKNEARTWLLKAVQQNNTQAQYDLALDLEKEKQFDQAAQWFTKLAMTGHVPSQYSLGSLYLGYGGAAKQPVLARQWLEKAVQAGNTNAQLTYGVALITGEDGFPANPQVGAKWVLSAAEKNNGKAQFVAAGIYSVGNGVPKSLQTALDWARRSKDSGYDEADAMIEKLTKTSLSMAL